MSWRELRLVIPRLLVTGLILSGLVGASVFIAVRSASARDGAQGGAPRSFVTVAGTVRGLPGNPSMAAMTFRFRRVGADAGAPTPLCAPTVSTAIADDGTFSAEVPLDGDASRCPGDLFDGRDVVVEVTVNGFEITGRDGPFRVNPVPYALHAGFAGAAAGTLETRIAGLEQRVRDLEGNNPAPVRASGSESATDRDVVLPLSRLLAGSPTLQRAQRALLLTVSANGDNAVLTGTWLVITGGASGAIVQSIALHRYNPTGVVDVVAPFNRDLYTTDDVQRGVTLRFRGMPTTSRWSWSYTATPIDLPAM